MTVILGDCVEVMRGMEPNSVDAIVTDPPAGIAFMNREWDSDKGGRDAWVAWLTEVMRECHRVLKPGGHALVWALPRTSHWTALAVEDAGFEIRDRIAHHQGSGFPKSLSVNKAAAKAGVSCQCQTGDVYYPYEQERATEVTSDNQDVRGLRQGMGTTDTLSGGAQQDVLPSVQRQAHLAVESGEEVSADPFRDMPAVRDGVRHSELPGQSSSAVLLDDMLREVALDRPDHSSAHGVDFREHEGPQAQRSEVRREQSSLERRSDVLQDARQLHGRAVRQGAGVGQADGPHGRLCDGASAVHGADDRTPAGTGRGCASPRSQPGEQCAEQPRIVADEQRAQTGRAWPDCPRCGLPVLPEGLGTALKPSTEDWWLARKPLSESTVAANCLRWGTGALNIDQSRIGTTEEIGRNNPNGPYGSARTWNVSRTPGRDSTGAVSGRWPANVILSHSLFCRQVGTRRVKSGNGSLTSAFVSDTNMFAGRPPEASVLAARYSDADGYEEVEAWECVENCPVRLLDAQSGERKSGGGNKGNRPGSRGWFGLDAGNGFDAPYDASTGGASRYYKTIAYSPDEVTRFLYQAKAPRSERVLSNHPTQKPVALMRYLVQLVTPPGGVVLDPFAGSGTTGVACAQLGIECVLIEREAEYVTIIERRLQHAREAAA